MKNILFTGDDHDDYTNIMNDYKCNTEIEKQRNKEIENKITPFVQRCKNTHKNKKYRKYHVITVFDVESTGLIPPKKKVENNQNQKIEEENTAELPYITQLSFIQYNVLSGSIIKKYNAYIKIPPEIEISEKITELTGITREICNEHGVPITTALLQLFMAYSSSACIVAHNLSFDKQMIEIEIKRNYSEIQNVYPIITNMFNPEYEVKKEIDLYCTMLESVHICNIMVPKKNDPTKTYKKYPKLEELYMKLFGKKPENLHNSLIDTLVCLRCFLKIRLHLDIHDAKYDYFYNHIMKNDMI